MKLLGKKIQLPFQIRKRKPSAMHQIIQLLDGVDVKVVYDVGAHNGKVAQEYVDKFPQAQVYAFEPTPESYSALKERHANSKRVNTYPFAVSEEDGRTTFHINKSSQTNSILPSGEQADQLFGGDVSKTTESIEVETISLDSFSNKNNVSHVNILKMDIQGAELYALKGARSMLAEQKIDLIFCEVEFYPLYNKQPLFHDIGSFLSPLGYHLFNFDNMNIKKPINQLLWCDAIFVSERILKRQFEHLNR